MNRLTSSDINIIADLPPRAEKGMLACFDTEFFGMDKARLHRPHGTFASMACTYDGVNVYYITDSNLIPEFMQRIDAALWVGHNIAFDIRQLRMYTEITPRKRVYDTMLVDQIRFRGYYDDFALNDLARRYLHTYLDKSQQKSFEKSTELTREQVVYGALDVAATWKIAQVQRDEIDDDDLWIWQNIERPIMWMLLTVKGVMVDTKKWMEIAAEKGDKAGKLWQECEDEYGINIRSTQQLKEFLFQNKIKTDSVNVEALSHLSEKHPIIQKVLDYRKPQKGASTYGSKWVDEHVESDGRVYCSWRQYGARTGRFSSAEPCLQNIPVRKEPVYRESFIADEGKVFVIADWSSQEPRIMGFLSQDKNLMDVFKSGDDIYIGCGEKVFGQRFEKKSKERQEMKSTVLGLNYGMTKYGLAEDIETKTGETCTTDRAQEIINKYFKTFPGVEKYISEIRKYARKNGRIETIYGRKCWISPYERGLDQQAPNFKIQGSAGDAMKIAAVAMANDWIARYGYNPFVLFVHDEFVIEVEKELADIAVKLLSEHMKKAAEDMHPGVPSLADVYVGSSWAEKH